MNKKWIIGVAIVVVIVIITLASIFKGGKGTELVTVQKVKSQTIVENRCCNRKNPTEVRS